MAGNSHLRNVKTRPQDWKFTWVTATSSYIIDRGSANFPGTQEAEEYTYTTDEETLKETSTSPGYTNIQLETVLDDFYDIALAQSLEATSGALKIDPKENTIMSGQLGYTWYCNLAGVSEPSFNSNEFPVYSITFSVLGGGKNQS